MTGNSTSQTGQDKDNNHDNNKKRITIDMVTKHFKGDNANIGAVIGLKHEIIDAKKDFEKFTQKIASHVATNVTIHRNLNPAASGTSGQSRNDDSLLKESSESGSCGDDTLKRSYRSVLIGGGK